MSRANRRHPCVYCSSGNGTDDHVFARAFFCELDRGNLPRAPACGKCNGRKAELEAYVSTILPLCVSDAGSKILEAAANRLENNQKLRRSLSAPREPSVVEVSPYRYELRPSLPLDFEKVGLLFEMITRGLIWHHWRYILPADCGTRAIAMPASFSDQQLRHFNRDEHYIENCIAKTFLYRAWRACDAPYTSVWRHQFVGGGGFGIEGDPMLLDEIVIATAPQEFVWDLQERELTKERGVA